MKYSGYRLDEIGRAVTCPRCENEDVKGVYCHICGTYLINKCTGFYDGYTPQYPILWHEVEGCGKLLDGDARFCTECASSTTFFEQNLLRDWKVEKEHVESDPFGDQPKLHLVGSSLDDDFPF